MKRIYANTPGTAFPPLTPEGRTILIREEHGCGSDIVTGATRAHERNTLPVQDTSERTGSRHASSWVRLVRNRIAFRHDDKRGPISATLIHAVY